MIMLRKMTNERMETKSSPKPKVNLRAQFSKKQNQRKVEVV